MSDCKFGAFSKYDVFKLLVRHLATLNQLHAICYAVTAVILWHEDKDDAFCARFSEINYKQIVAFVVIH